MKKRLVFIAMAVALLGSACVKVNLKVDVNEDGSGSVEGLTAFNYEAFGSLAADFGDDAGLPAQDELCSEFESDIGIEGSDFDEARAFEEDGFCGVEFKTSFSEGEFEQALGGLDSDGATLRREGDGWYFEQTFAAEDFSTDGAEFIPGFEDLFEDAEYIVQVRLPGRQVDHNGEIDPEGFVVWDIDITNPPASIFLRTEPGQRETGSASVGGGDDGGGSALTVILIVVAVLAALGLAAWLLMRNRQKHTDAPASGIAATIPNDAPTAPPMDPTAQMPTSPPVDPTAQMAATPPAEPAAPAPTTAEDPPQQAPSAGGSPTPEEATGQPAWDPVRGKYVQWDPNNSRWLVHDEAAGGWVPET